MRGGCTPGKSRPWQLAAARAHQENSARARRRRVKVSSTFSKVAGGAGARWAPSSARSPLPRRSVLDVCHWQTAPEAAAEKGGSAPKVLWRQQAQERLKMSRWDIFRWRTLAGGRWCPVGTVQRSVSAAASVGAGRLPLADSTRGGSRDPCWHLRCHKDFHQAPLSPRPKRVPPFGISDGGETRRSASAVDSRLWQLASLVLIERIAHVRGGGWC